MNDYAELLRNYASGRSEESFVALVDRYLPLVYRAALRRTGGDTHRAQDISQMVFIAVARNARRLARHPDLAGWLYTTTRFIAATSLRSETRRHAREHAAAMISNTHSEPANPAALNALLDDAIAELRQIDRQIILLRFYHGLSLAEIGAQVGATENAIQKRTDRALDVLKAKLARRGATSTAAAIALALEAQSTIAVPAGLAAAASSAALTLGTGTGVIAGTTFMILSKFQIGFAVAAMLVTAGGFVWEHRTTEKLREQVGKLQAEQQHLANERDRLRSQLGDAERRLAAPPPRINVPALTTDEAALGPWLDRVVQLRRKLDAMPQLKIPEMQLLTAEDWLAAVQNTKLESDDDFRAAARRLRESAKKKFAPQLMEALRAFANASAGTSPSDPSQLLPYLSAPVDGSFLERYRIVDTGLGGRESGQFALEEKITADQQGDTQYRISQTGITSHSSLPLADAIKQAAADFQAANPGRKPESGYEIVAYIKDPLLRAQYEAILARGGAR